jgi:serine/threonine protein kinase
LNIVYSINLGHEIAKISHRDITLGNLLINDKNLLKLCDFGSSMSFIITDGDMINSIIPLSAKSIWSAKVNDILQIGLILYHMVYGKHYLKER